MNLELIMDNSLSSFMTDCMLFLCMTRALSISFIANWVIFSPLSLVLLTRQTLPNPPRPIAYLYSNRFLLSAKYKLKMNDTASNGKIACLLTGY